MNRLPTRTSIRSERPALVALGAIALACLIALGITVALGDQRTVSVVLTSVDPGASVPSTTRAISLTFDRETDHDAVEARLSTEPATEGILRWRGRTLELTFAGTLSPGPLTVTVAPGAIGRGGESLREPFVLSLTVREPSLVVLGGNANGSRLMLVRDGESPVELAASWRIPDFQVAPDGSVVAVILTEESLENRLVLVDTTTLAQETIVDSPNIDLGSVAWAPDSQAMTVIRRERLPGGGEGVPRLWLMRRNGEFLGPVDPDGDPTLSAAWSPDGQFVAYLAPATGEVVVQNMATNEARVIGRPRGGVPAWSPDSRRVAFTSVPPADSGGTGLLQPVRVGAIDGTFDRSFGAPNEIRSVPGFFDASTLLSLRRAVGNPIGTELVFESMEDGTQLRSILLESGSTVVFEWDLDPSGGYVAWASQFGSDLKVTKLDLVTGERVVLPFAGQRIQWLP